MKVYLHAGDAMTVNLNTKSVLSALNPELRLFGPDPANPVDLSADLTTSFQDAGQIPFGSLQSGGLSLRQFDPNAPSASAQNLYLPPPIGQPGSDSDLYYTFTAQTSGYYYVGVSGQGNDNYDPTTVTPNDPAAARTNGSTGFYQIQVSVGPVNLRGGNVTHGDPAINGFAFGPNPSSNQKVPTDNNVAIGSFFYGSPYANVDDPGASVNDTTVRVVKYDNMQGDTAVTHTQGTLIIASNQISNSLSDGILVTASPREGAVGSANPNLPHQGGVVNLPVLDTARLVPGAVIDNNIVNGFGNAGIQFSGDGFVRVAGFFVPVLGPWRVPDDGRPVQQ